MAFKKLSISGIKDLSVYLTQKEKIKEFLDALYDDKCIVIGYENGNNKITALSGVKYLDMDTEHFKKKHGRFLNILSEDSFPVSHKNSLIQYLMKHVAASGFRHISAKCSSDDISAVRILENHDFNVVVCNLILTRNIPNKIDIDFDSHLVRNALFSDLSRLQAIASKAFSDKTRFHLDSRFPAQKSTELHAKWIKNLLIDSNVKVLCSEIDSKVIGFVTFQLSGRNDINKEQKGYIDLIAVDNKFRERGIGSNLIKTVLHNLKGKVQCVMVDTESFNYPALRLYQKNDFIITGSRFILHKWIE